jgi:hypothetical protein
LAIGLLVIYQTFSLSLFATTLGKRLFDLKVVSMFGERLSVWDYGVRSLVWILELLLFGLPWLAVFSNSKRRPLHDRVSDTIVVSSGKAGLLSPSKHERALVRGVFVVFAGLCFFALVIQVHGVMEKLKTEESLASIMAKDNEQCEAVSRQRGDEGESGGDSGHSRLETAMILYAAGLVNTECLESEVEREVRMQIPVAPLTYLAQAFIYADDAEISNSYLDEVCNVAADTVECAMSRLVNAWSDENWRQVESILRSAPLGSSGYLEVWGVRHYMKQAKYHEALGLIERFPDRSELRDFSLVQRVKALYSLSLKAVAEVAYQQAFVALPVDDGKALSAWMCAQELQYGCQALEGVACRHMDRAGNEGGEGINFQLANEAMAQVLAMECGAKVDYLKLSDATAEEKPWQMFFRANLKRQREDRSAAFDLFMKVVNSPDSPELLRVEAARRVMKFATPGQMKQLVARWNGLESREAWVRMGKMLLHHLGEQRSELATAVSRELLSAQAMAPESFSRKPASTEEEE